MKKQYLLLSIISVIFTFSQCGVKDYASNASPASHKIWDTLLQKHVSADGWVDYQGFIQDSTLFNQYINELESHHPNKKWSREEKMAYWINVYNAYTVKVITDHYPTKSIKAIKKGIPFINSVWDIKFIHIEGATYDLNNIEHGILREKFNDPRIHFAINCASISCPRLNNHAYFAKTLDSELDKAARDFFGDKSKNIITPQKIQLSRILKWFHGDFVSKDVDFISFLNKFSPVDIEKNAKVEYLDYNWGLNEREVGINEIGSIEEETETPKAYIADTFDYPVGKPDGKGYYNAQGFGKNAHLGDDWNAVTGGDSDLGDPIYAVANGYVKFAEDIAGGWGNVVRITHELPNGEYCESLYAHCDSILIKSDVWVKKGQPIATIGTANGLYPAHLHLEIRADINMPIGGGYANDIVGYLNPTTFIDTHRK